MANGERFLPNGFLAPPHAKPLHPGASRRRRRSHSTSKRCFFALLFHGELGDLSSSSYQVFFLGLSSCGADGSSPRRERFHHVSPLINPSFAPCPARSGPGLPATIAWRLTANNCPDRQTRLAVYYGRPQEFSSLWLTGVTPTTTLAPRARPSPRGHEPFGQPGRHASALVMRGMPNPNTAGIP